MENNYNDLIGDIIKSSKSMDDIKGKGKPLSKEYLRKDTFQHFQKIAKEAGYLPEWLNLQKEIHHELTLIQPGKQNMDKINNKIRKYNKLCPAPLQKPLVNEDNFKDECHRWK
ncbi:DnaJ family domain-containing protein [Salipaludibacillus aurantiacus]|uniref:DnaJ homologue subfamily C member 28 conserved domain-containing protein n=1 Tax=Salipaludibacillus aurantiacus TaxID=1601833 RepID=A0A1H9XA04_9BACI|nr:DnaJ family domain-containing protein [Salipaludibacillus aurantiacus]SES43000.1 protein of unknown function [Salipaludibacillus aurantiacus]